MFLVFAFGCLAICSTLWRALLTEPTALQASEGVVMDAPSKTRTSHPIGVDLKLDDFCLMSHNATETWDLYDLVVRGYRRASTTYTANCDPSEWLAVMADRSSPNQRSTD